MQQVRAVALTGFLEAASFVGLDGRQLLREMRITPGMLADPENRIPAAMAIDLVEQAAERSHYDSFGLLMVSSRTFASLGPIALLLQHLGTVADVIETMIEYRRYIADIFVMDIESTDDTSVITIGLSDRSKRQALDIAVAAAYLALTGASGGRWSPETVYLAHDPPSDAALWDRMFRAPLEFRSSFSGFSCPSAALTIKIPLANAELAQHARQLLKLVSLPRIDEPMAERARRNILLLLPGGQTTLHAVAKNMGMSGRTLQRQLDGEGKTFAQLLNDVRHELVQRHLAGSTQTVSSVAEMTGYNSVSAFSRWFNAEYGMTPTDWRAAQRKGAGGPPPIWQV
jgi:AraC-like DNA-binding protein